MHRILILLTCTLPLAAQWLDHKDPQTPRSRDGRPNLTAPAPQIDGKPDLSGVWQAQRTPVAELTRVLSDAAKVQVDISDITKYMINVFWDTRDAEQPLRPAALAVMRERRGIDFGTARCLPAGVPAGLLIYPFKMVQAAHEILTVSGSGDPARQIYTDGRSLPGDPQPAWMGYSVGTWEGDTLRVETAGFTSNSWLDAVGHPRSESMRITERYHRRDFGHMDLEITFNDPVFYTRQFSIRTELELLPDNDVLEFVCEENEKDRAHVERLTAAAK